MKKTMPKKSLKLSQEGPKWSQNLSKNRSKIDTDINVEKRRKKYEQIMKNYDVKTIKIELSYHSGAIFKKIVKIRKKKLSKRCQKITKRTMPNKSQK